MNAAWKSGLFLTERKHTSFNKCVLERFHDKFTPVFTQRGTTAVLRDINIERGIKYAIIHRIIPLRYRIYLYYEEKRAVFRLTLTRNSIF